MTIATGSRHDMAYIAETTFGTTPPRFDILERPLGCLKMRLNRKNSEKTDRLLISDMGTKACQVISTLSFLMTRSMI